MALRLNSLFHTVKCHHSRARMANLRSRLMPFQVSPSRSKFLSQMIWSAQSLGKEVQKSMKFDISVAVLSKSMNRRITAMSD